MSTGRLEAFSDGVIAVAITLLVLNLVVPSPSHHEPLARSLAAEWPAFVAYLISFVTIGVIWINHHAAVMRLQAADHAILVSNLLLLLTIVLLPFATSLMATYLQEGQGEHLAAAIYGGALLLMALAFSQLNWQILLKRPHLMREPLPLSQRRAIFRRAVLGVVPYMVATAIAPLTPYATIALSGVLAAFYAMPFSRGE